ncbi:helix-turn-helix transcriptional regulator [Ruegeria lacuscaerulensis]|uniref:helix-turn-helix transcriptional regulator n=1 Tax=Ruegeria lacuscaerulensis TaxID=55218 RepID=UPI00147A6291|nr:helix-turn-helix transcriptional regulator [Ruegeria lacuscaerulensis]
MTSLQSDLIQAIYDTVVAPEGWQDVLDRVAEAVDARGCIMFDLVEDPYGKQQLVAPFMSSRYDPAAVAGYAEAFAKWEIEDQRLFARHSSMGDHIDVIGEEVLAETPEAVARRPNAQAMAEFGIMHRGGALLSRDQPMRDRFSVQFSRRHGPLGQSDRAILSTLLPHMAKACELARPVRQLRLRSQVLVDAIDQLRIGICLVRANGTVLVHNQEFQRQLEEVRLFRVTPEGRLEPQAEKHGDWFRRMTRSAGKHGRFGARPRKEALAAEDETGPVLAVEIVPLASDRVLGEPIENTFMVCSLDTSSGLELNQEMIDKVLKLTPSESALVTLLAEGMTNRQIAERRDRSTDTVNAQVKTLLSKTSCSNRTQLIRRVSSIGGQFLTSR